MHIAGAKQIANTTSTNVREKKIGRDQVVPELLAYINDKTMVKNQQLLKMPRFRFDGEQGVDDGGLTSESEFLNQI